MVAAADKNDIVFAIGPAGTGKTYTAVALAVRALKNKLVKKIILTRPAVEAGESLGFLPGDLKEKIDPYLRPLYDALDDMIPADKLGYYMSTRVIEIAPLAYMRGRTLDNAFIILDEAQNTTDLQLKMFLTRIGASAKAIITGDLTQVDLPKNQRSGLDKGIRILKNIDGISHIELDEEDVMVLLGAGESGKDPIVLQLNGTAYRGFLEGRVNGETFILLLHLSNMELKKPVEKPAKSEGEDK
jgi:phosphate starvation-inducible PhoH-like protein